MYLDQAFFVNADQDCRSGSGFWISLGPFYVGKLKKKRCQFYDKNLPLIIFAASFKA